MKTDEDILAFMKARQELLRKNKSKRWWKRSGEKTFLEKLDQNFPVNSEMQKWKHF